ncbi:uncharacterized protein LOC124703373 [Lolium rigidum]|uniref:uncharacterized protein LOC124703373 n=1 Tax=Lolium rigidum TaxID=89674 RepID=UPI001F5C19B0|nr:uncharacterized protein LOC124703373 [Lolium rigidum]
MQLLGMNFLGNMSSASLIYCRLKAHALISGDASQNYPKIVVYHLLFLPMLSKNIQLAHTPPLSSPSQASSLRSSGVTAQGQPCSVPVAWKMQKCRSRSSARKTWPCGSRSSIRLSLRAAIALCSATVLACTIVEQWRTKVLGSPSRPPPSGGLPDSSQERGAPARPLEQCSSVHGRILLDLWPPLHRHR